MKHLFRFFLPLIMFFAAGLVGCSSDPDVQGGSGDDDKNLLEKIAKMEPAAQIVSVNPGCVDVKFTVKTLNCTAMAYSVKAAGSKTDDATLLFANAQSGQTGYRFVTLAAHDLEAEDYNVTTEIDNTMTLVPEGGYQIQIAFMTNRQNYQVNGADELFYEEFTTEPEPDYEPGLTILKPLADGFIFHIELDEMGEAEYNGETYTNALKWSAANIYQYNSATIAAGNPDAFALTLHDAYYPWLLLKESKTITMSNSNSAVTPGDGAPADEEDRVKWDPIMPGQPTYFVWGEFEYGDSPWFANFTNGYYNPCFDNDSFLANEHGSLPFGTEYNNQGDYWYGQYGREIHYTQKPTKMEANVKVEMEARPNDATITLTPEEGVVGFAYWLLDHSTWQQFTTLLMGEEHWQWFLTSYNGFMEGVNTIVGSQPIRFNMSDTMYASGLNPGVLYHLMVTAIGSDDFLVQSYQDYTFELPARTKSAPEIIVTPLEDQTTHEYIYFNVKAPNKDAYNIQYLLGYRQEFESYLMNYTYSSLVATYGALLGAADIEKVNSDEGFTMEFTSKADADNRLAVLVTNDEGLTNANQLDAKGSQAVADLRSKPEPGEPRVDSPYFTSLLGEWTASAKIAVSKYNSETATYEWHLVETPMECAVKIVEDGLFDTPETLPDYVFDLYPPTISEETIRGYYEEFLVEGERYNNRIYNRNYITCLGMNFFPAKTDAGNDNNFHIAMETASPWDLFVMEDYASSTIADFFYDFGPKWYFHVKEDGSLVVPVNTGTIDPITDWCDQYSYYLVGWNLDNNYYLPYDYDVYGATGEFADLEFPVVVSDDNNTITIKGYNYKDAMYYPSIAAFVSNQPYIDAVVVSEITMTRNANEAAIEQNNADAMKTLSEKPIARVAKPAGPEFVSCDHKPMRRGNFNLNK